MLRRDAIQLSLALGLAVAASLVLAQGRDSYTARLSWVPISGAERADVAGRGRATATLARSRLALTGTFEGLPGAATTASLRQGAAVGARGPVVAELQITRSPSGEISGEVDLSRDQVAALRAGQLYVQIHAERGVAPDNAVLWGWLLANTR